jgi:hypothetical protein
LGAGGLELAQILECAAVGALEGVAAALDAGQGLLGTNVGSPLNAFVRHGIVGMPVVPGPLAALDFIELVVPELGFGFAEAAEQPLGVDEDIDEGALGE